MDCSSVSANMSERSSLEEFKEELEGEQGEESIKEDAFSDIYIKTTPLPSKKWTWPHLSGRSMVE